MKRQRLDHVECADNWEQKPVVRSKERDQFLFMTGSPHTLEPWQRVRAAMQCALEPHPEDLLEILDLGKDELRADRQNTPCWRTAHLIEEELGETA